MLEVLHRISWHVPYKMPNLSAICQSGPASVFSDDFMNFLHIFYCMTCGSEPYFPQNQENRSNICVLLMTLSLKAVLCISNGDFRSLKQN